ncbi:MAG: hypothetical protein HGA70_08025 [Chlorobiaceae bacterium]|nr:hypothetical protein [Chlorobiaceae bacterium]
MVNNGVVLQDIFCLPAWHPISDVENAAEPTFAQFTYRMDLSYFKHAIHAFYGYVPKFNTEPGTLVEWLPPHDQC